MQYLVNTLQDLKGYQIEKKKSILRWEAILEFMIFLNV